MKLLPPSDFQYNPALRPPVNTRVVVVNPNDPDEEWPFFVRLRLDGYDLATEGAPGPTTAVDTTLVLRQAGQVLSFPVRLEPLGGPVTTWRILYLGAPETQDIRREWRNDVDKFTGFVNRLNSDEENRFPTMSYDFSPSAIRFFLPWRLDVGDLVAVRWRLENEWVYGTMRLVRRDDSVVWWKKQQGFQAVGQWVDLSQDMARLWRTYCWRHQPDAIATLNMSS